MLSRHESIHPINEAVEKGINFFDTGTYVRW